MRPTKEERRILDRYVAKTMAAWSDYQDVRGPAWRKYQDAIRLAKATYQLATTRAKLERDEALARLRRKT